MQRQSQSPIEKAHRGSNGCNCTFLDAQPIWGAGGRNQWIEPLAGVHACTVALVVAAGLLLVTPDARAQAQCPLPALTSGLLTPLGVAQSTQGNLLVAETGIHGVPNSGRISIVDVRGHRSTLVEGLPSGTNDVNEPSGPAGIIIRGRTAYVAIGIGDSGLPGPFPGTLVVNPTPSSALFSSVLAIHFSAAVEKGTSGFSLTSAHNAALAAGERVTLSNGAGDRATIEVVANFPDSTPAPLAGLPDNRRGANPFDLVALGDDLFVTDGGQNAIWRVDLATGAFEVLTTFPQIVNPMFPFGPPTIDAVPTGIRGTRRSTAGHAAHRVPVRGEHVNHRGGRSGDRRPHTGAGSTDDGHRRAGGRAPADRVLGPPALVWRRVQRARTADSRRRGRRAHHDRGLLRSPGVDGPGQKDGGGLRNRDHGWAPGAAGLNPVQARSRLGE